MSAKVLALFVRALSDPQFLNSALRYSGVFRGYVEDVSDPQNRCRVRVRVVSVHGSIPVHALPWADRIFPDGGGKDHGTLTPLTPCSGPMKTDGDSVFIMFEGGDTSLPVVLGTWYGAYNGVSEVPAEAQSGETQRRCTVHKTRHGTRIEVSDEPSDYEVKIVMPGGNVVQLRESAGGRGIHVNTAGGHKISLQDEHPGTAAPDTGNAYDATRDVVHENYVPRALARLGSKAADGVVKSGTAGAASGFGQKGVIIQSSGGHKVELRDVINPGISATTALGHKIELRDVVTNSGIAATSVLGHEVEILDTLSQIRAQTSGGNIMLLQDNLGVSFTSQYGQTLTMSSVDFGLFWPATGMQIRFGGGTNEWQIVGDLTINATGNIIFRAEGDVLVEAGRVLTEQGASRVEIPPVGPP